MTKNMGWKTPLVGLVLSASLLTAACGTVGGAAVGAGSGAAIGAGTGYGAGKGALIGTGVGAAAGAIYDITKKQMTGGDMKIGTRYGVALAAPILLWSATAFGQDGAIPRPARLAHAARRWKVRSSRSTGARGESRSGAADGTIHEFTASAETLQDLKEGDRIEARLRR